MKTAALALILIFSAIGIGFYYSSFKSTDIHVIPAKEFKSSSIDISTLIKQNADYRNRIKELERENQNLQNQIRTQKKAGAPTATTSTAQTEPRQAAVSAGEMERQINSAATAADLTKYLSNFSNKSPADINRDLKDRFDSESIDHPWASDHERKLSELFSEDEDLSAFVPENITCKKTRCRVTVPISSYEESNRVMTGVTQALQKNVADLEETMVLTIPSPSTGFVDFYIARDSNIKLYQ